MTSPETAFLRAAAARNNAAWCDAVCRSHGGAGTHGERSWHSALRTPPYYPDAVTLRPDAVAEEVLAGVDTLTPGCSVKDSFVALDLSAHGFTALFDAWWIHRPAGGPVPVASGLRAQRVRDRDELAAWQTAWHADGPPPDVFRPALLEDASVRVLTVVGSSGPVGGFVLNAAAGLVGVSNVFARGDGADGGGRAVWACAVAAAAEHFPGLPLAGYEHDGDLQSALACGFTVIGPLRVWLRDV